MSKENKNKMSRRDFFWSSSMGICAAATMTTGTPLHSGQFFESGQFSDPAGRPKRPWWVKTVYKPTTEIDWKRMQRYNERMGTVRGPGFEKYIGQEEVNRLRDDKAEILRNGILKSIDGYTLKDQALKSSHVSVDMNFLGPRKAPTPEKRGVPNWSGTPEEAARIIRVAMRHYGVARVGFIELDENTRKLIYSVDPDGKELIFTDEERAYETETARYIPNKCKYVIVYTIQMSGETMRRAPTSLAFQTTMMTYARATRIQASLQEFLRGLGYQCLGESSNNALGIAPALGVLAGLGEMSRLNRMISPEFGPMVRIFKALTDLPVALDKPIDAGIMKFCRHCKKCAQSCPSGSLSLLDEPTWETEGEWNNPGHKAYFDNSLSCYTYWQEEVATNCGICFSVCPFTKKDKAWIHKWVKAGVSKAPCLDPFFSRMDDVFGYGEQAGSEEWWQLDLPELGCDSNKPVSES